MLSSIFLLVPSSILYLTNADKSFWIESGPKCHEMAQKTGHNHGVQVPFQPKRIRAPLYMGRKKRRPPYCLDVTLFIALVLPHPVYGGKLLWFIIKFRGTFSKTQISVAFRQQGEKTAISGIAQTGYSDRDLSAMSRYSVAFHKRLGLHCHKPRFL